MDVTHFERRHLGRSRKFVADIVSWGAARVSARRYGHPDYPRGSYFAPTLLVGGDTRHAHCPVRVLRAILTLTLVPPVWTADMLAIANVPSFCHGAPVFGSEQSPATVLFLHCFGTSMVTVNDFAASLSLYY